MLRKLKSFLIGLWHEAKMGVLVLIHMLPRLPGLFLSALRSLAVAIISLGKKIWSKVKTLFS